MEIDGWAIVNGIIFEFKIDLIVWKWIVNDKIIGIYDSLK